MPDILTHIVKESSGLCKLRRNSLARQHKLVRQLRNYLEDLEFLESHVDPMMAFRDSAIEYTLFQIDNLSRRLNEDHGTTAN